MSDSDLRRWSDSFDDDAIFADIVAHLTDEAKEPERAPRPATGDAATHLESPEDAGAEEGSTGTAEDRSTGTADKTPTESTAEPLADFRDKPTEEPSDLTSEVRPQDNPDMGQPSQSGQPTQDSAHTVLPPPSWRGQVVDDEDQEHFEPPPTSPLPAGDLQFWAIICGMGGGPLLLLYIVFFNRDASSYWILTALAMSIGGFALLVSRLPGHHEDDDNGARL